MTSAKPGEAQLRPWKKKLVSCKRPTSEMGAFLDKWGKHCFSPGCATPWARTAWRWSLGVKIRIGGSYRVALFIEPINTSFSLTLPPRSV